MSLCWTAAVYLLLCQFNERNSKVSNSLNVITFLANKADSVRKFEIMEAPHTTLQRTHTHCLYTHLQVGH